MIMKPPRAELTPRQLAASCPTELQTMARMHNLELGQVKRNRNLYATMLSDLRHKSQHYNRFMADDTLAVFQEAISDYQELIASLDAIMEVLPKLQADERVALKRRTLNDKHLGVSL